MATPPDAAPPATSERPAPDAPRARRRGAELERALLDAAWGEVMDVGYDRATMDGIAKRAGTNKATLYRRWPNRTELLVVAIDRHVTALGPTPVRTTDLRAGAIAVLETMRDRCQAVAAIPDTTGALAAQVGRQAAREASDRMTELVHAAAQRGDIDGAVTPLVARCTVDVLYAELALGERVGHPFVVDIVDQLLLPLAGYRAAGRPD